MAPTTDTKRPQRGRLDRTLLPDPLAFYEGALGRVKGHAEWRTAHCPMHEARGDHLRVNVARGSFACMSCGFRGGDVLSFVMQQRGIDFMQAARLSARSEKPSTAK